MEIEFQEIDDKGGWAQVFQQLRVLAAQNPNQSFKIAKLPKNRPYNRYGDVSPYDHSRICLKTGDIDYINASLLTVERAHRRYILTQGPLPHTSGHFWQMVWEQNTKGVLMLNKVIEKNTVKCHQYWPLGVACGGEQQMVFEDVGLQVEYVSEEESINYTLRHLRLTNLTDRQSRMILHYHYTTWPDFGVPESPSDFLDFLWAVRESGALEDSVGPAVVHCSAGIGRSGTFCLVDCSLVIIAETGDLNAVKIKDLLLEMRQYRMGLIQTPDQLRFSYLSIIEGARALLNNVNSLKRTSSQRSNDTEHNHSSHSDTSEGDLANGTGSPPPLPPRKAAKSAPHSSVNHNHNQGSLPGSAPAEHPSDAEDYDVPRAACSSIPAIEKAKNAELRKRLRQERSNNLADKVNEIRRKQKESESHKHRRSLFLTLSIGFVMIVGGGFLAYKYLYTAQPVK